MKTLSLTVSLALLSSDKIKDSIFWASRPSWSAHNEGVFRSSIGEMDAFFSISIAENLTVVKNPGTHITSSPHHSQIYNQSKDIRRKYTNAVWSILIQLPAVSETWISALSAAESILLGLIMMELRWWGFYKCSLVGRRGWRVKAFVFSFVSRHWTRKREWEGNVKEIQVNFSMFCLPKGVMAKPDSNVGEAILKFQDRSVHKIMPGIVGSSNTEDGGSFLAWRYISYLKGKKILAFD